MTSFRKTFALLPTQIEILQQRGLKIENSTETDFYLNHVGYYRLSGYWQFLQKNRVSHDFFPDTSFDQVVELYNFDRELRLLLLDAIEHIEVSFRAIMINHLCRAYGTNWFTDKSLFHSNEKMNDAIDTINRELDRSEEEFIKHHDRKYGKSQHPPAWKTLQILTLGTLSKIYDNISNVIDEKKTIAIVYGLPNEEWLRSWMQVLSILRNYCAHHSRLCYRLFSIRPKDMRSRKLPWIKEVPSDRNLASRQLYYQLCVVRYLLHTASPGNDFSYKLMELLVKYPGIELDRMGFPENWYDEDLWQ